MLPSGKNNGRTEKIMFRELTCKHDRHKSFYHKAWEEYTESGKINLYSYESLVASIENGKLIVYNGWYEKKKYAYGYEYWEDAQFLDYDTTLRHVKEFAYQHGFGELTKSELKAMAIEV